MKELLRNKVVGKKDDQFCDFDLNPVSNSSNTTTSIDNPNTISNAQEYMVSIYISKMNLFWGDICTYVVIYPVRWPF